MRSRGNNPVTISFLESIVDEANIDFEMAFCETVTFFRASYRRPAVLFRSANRSEGAVPRRSLSYGWREFYFARDRIGSFKLAFAH